MPRNPKRVESTGAVDQPSSPVETTATPGRPESTGAVELPELGETRATHLGEEITVRQETPSEPFTASVTWLSEAETKVVQPQEEAPAPKPSPQQPAAKSGDAETRE
jgi:hypothetical protein